MPVRVYNDFADIDVLGRQNRYKGCIDGKNKVCFGGIESRMVEFYSKVLFGGRGKSISACGIGLCLTYGDGITLPRKADCNAFDGFERVINTSGEGLGMALLTQARIAITKITALFFIEVRCMFIKRSRLEMIFAAVF